MLKQKVNDICYMFTAGEEINPSKLPRICLPALKARSMHTSAHARSDSKPTNVLIKTANKNLRLLKLR